MRIALQSSSPVEMAGATSAPSRPLQVLLMGREDAFEWWVDVVSKRPTIGEHIVAAGADVYAPGRGDGFD